MHRNAVCLPIKMAAGSMRTKEKGREGVPKEAQCEGRPQRWVGGWGGVGERERGPLPLQAQQSNLLTFGPVDHTRESPLPEIFRSPVLGLGRQKAEKREGREGRVPLKGKRKQITHPFQALWWVPPGALDPQFPQGY